MQRSSLTTLLALTVPLVSFFTPLIFIPSGDKPVEKYGSEESTKLTFMTLCDSYSNKSS